MGVYNYLFFVLKFQLLAYIELRMKRRGLIKKISYPRFTLNLEQFI